MLRGVMDCRKVGPLKHQLLLRDAQLRRLRTRVDLFVTCSGRLRKRAMQAQKRINAVEQGLINQENSGARPYATWLGRKGRKEGVTARAQGGLNPSRRATSSYASIKDAAWCSHTKSGARDTARR